MAEQREHAFANRTLASFGSASRPLLRRYSTKTFVRLKHAKIFRRQFKIDMVIKNVSDRLR
jgi:hypothetical protein